MILRPNLGLILDSSVITLPEGALSAGMNFRVRDGELSNLNLGWARWGNLQIGVDRAAAAGDFQPGYIQKIYNFTNRNQVQKLVIVTTTDIFEFVSENSEALLLNPRYETGTANTTNNSTTVVGTGTAWLSNVKAGDLFFRGSTGLRHTTSNFWHQVATVDSDTSLTLTAPYTGSTGTSAYTISKRFTGSIDDRWSVVTFLHEAVGDEDWVILTNGIDDIVKWNGTATQVSSLGVDFKAKHLIVYKNMLICTAITDAGEFLPTQMRNSDVGSPSDFSSGLSEIFTVHAGSEEVFPGLLGDVLVLYVTGKKIVVSDFVGDPDVFVFRNIADDEAPISPGMVADFGDHHRFIGDDSAFLFDGVTLAPHAAHVFRHALRQRDPSRFRRAFTLFDDEYGDLLWVFPQTTDVGDTPEIAWSEHHLEDTRVRGHVPFSLRDFPFTAAAKFQRQNQVTWDQLSGAWTNATLQWNSLFFETAFPLLITGDSSGFLYTYGNAQNGDGTALPSYVRFGRLPLSDGRERGLLRRVYLFVKQFAGNFLKVRTRMADNAVSPIQFSDEQELDLSLPEEGHFVSVFRRGRYYELEFATDGTPWQMAGFDVDVQKGGRR